MVDGTLAISYSSCFMLALHTLFSLKCPWLLLYQQYHAHYHAYLVSIQGCHKDRRWH